MRQFDLKTEQKTQLVDITERVQEALGEVNGASAALIYVPHTTAGVTINEGADPLVGRDITVGAILGLVLGFGLALIGTHLSPYVLTRDQAARATGAPVITASVGRRRSWHRSAPALPPSEVTALGAEASGALARRELNPRGIGSGSGALLVLSATPTRNSAGAWVCRSSTP